MTTHYSLSHDSHGHHHHTSVQNRHHAETFVRDNAANFLEQPIITNHGNTASVAFKMDEGTVKKKGLLSLTSINPNYSRRFISNASIATADNSLPAYLYFGSILQEIMDRDNTQAVQNGQFAVSTTADLGDFDNLSGLNNKLKVLHVTLVFVHDFISNN
jgi:hypothetical protein